MLKRVLGGLITALLLATPVLAQSVMCWDRNAFPFTYSKSGTYIVVPAEEAFPLYVKLTLDHVQWGQSRSQWDEPKENVGDGFPRWESIERLGRYKFKHNRAKNNLSVMLARVGIYAGSGVGQAIIQILYKKCELINSQSSFNTTVSNGASAFKQLSLCDRKYVQQFLKGQGLYSSVIDGLWGSGTAKAVSRASQKGKLRGLSNDEIITKLADNLVCD